MVFENKERERSLVTIAKKNRAKMTGQRSTAVDPSVAYSDLSMPNLRRIKESSKVSGRIRRPKDTHPAIGVTVYRAFGCDV